MRSWNCRSKSIQSSANEIAWKLRRRGDSYREILIFIEVPWEILRFLVNRVIFLDRERSGGIQEAANATISRRITERWTFMDCSPLPTEKIGHGSDGKVDHVVHAAGMNGVNHRAPFIASPPMRIESGQVQG